MMTEQNMTLVLLIIAAISYLLGSVNFSILFSRKANKDDIRNHGSGNAGATNMYRTHGSMAGMITVICDILKVLVAILIARLLLGEALFASYPFLFKYYAGLVCVVGHIFPVFFKCRGGKGVATCAGMILLL
ncbi:MAG: glycerol-3-phosphate acyltransferase, partial [Clostridiales bacterium]|nr:glycerol-3-phosphate acyltransferase [Clostridiales bacterium]